MKSIDIAVSIGKWLLLQYVLLALMPYFFEGIYGDGLLVLMFLYTTAYAVYWEYVPEEKRHAWLFVPYVAYFAIAATLSFIVVEWHLSLWLCVLWPLYGLVCFIVAKYVRRWCKKLKGGYKFAIALLFIVLKCICVAWECAGQGSFEGEKKDVLSRRDYLTDRLVVEPHEVLDAMPSAIGEQFVGEWALYSCSMLSAALVNISYLYPETRADNLQKIDSLIDIVMSDELRKYDRMRWYEDPLETLDGEKSHVSYLSHLAWMICGYKKAGGDGKYDELLASLCRTINRRIHESVAMNLPTYPGEAVYVPDMLVAIVALNEYADLYGGKYRSTVKKWVERARKEWLDEKSGLLVSFLKEDGRQYEDSPVKGSYSALNCYYLTFIDKAFAREQYDTLKSLFWKDTWVTGLKEYWDRWYYFGLDIDAGFILFELSPSGTAFLTGAATFFGDNEVRNGILKTAEIAGHTVGSGYNRHYLLGNVALVGEAIMLAMRTHVE